MMFKRSFFPDAKALLFRVDIWVLIALVLLSTYALRNLISSYPDGPTYSLSATAEHIELIIHGRSGDYVWTGLRLRQVDSRRVDCTVSELVLGKQPMTVSLDSLSSRTHHEDKNTSDSFNAFHVTLFLKHGEEPYLITCANGVVHTVMRSARLEPNQGSLGMTLSFFSDLKVGAQPDIKSSYSKILLSGSLRAMAKLKGSRQPGAVSQYELFPGDTINLTAFDGNSFAATGLIWSTADGLRLVAHSVDSAAYISRLGIGKIAEVELVPGAISILQADPALLLISAVLAGTLTFFPVMEMYVLRLYKWMRRLITHVNDNPK